MDDASEGLALFLGEVVLVFVELAPGKADEEDGKEGTKDVEEEADAADSLFMFLEVGVHLGGGFLIYGVVDFFKSRGLEGGVPGGDGEEE